MNMELDNGFKLPLMESFYSIQGEGFYTGHAAYFLRIGGCDVGCHWCDVKESWDPQIHPLTLVDDIISDCDISNTSTVVVTGGEPLMWNMDRLTQLLKRSRFITHLETSGSYELTGNWDWICLSPKKNQMPLAAIKPSVDELKIIIHNNHDFIFAEEQRVGLSENCKLYLQPEWSVRDKMLPLIIDYVMKHSDWRISLQTHKYLNIP